jgi:hypothetical protein
VNDLVRRALHYYNVGEGLTRADVVDMAKRLEVLEEIAQRVADGWVPLRGLGFTIWSRPQDRPEEMPSGVAAVLWPDPPGDPVSDRVVPDWALPVLGPAESSLRVLDTIVSRSTAGETVESLAEDYALDPRFVDTILKKWPCAEP